jgi:hypothetical protein
MDEITRSNLSKKLRQLEITLVEIRRTLENDRDMRTGVIRDESAKAEQWTRAHNGAPADIFFG